MNCFSFPQSAESFGSIINNYINLPNLVEWSNTICILRYSRPLQEFPHWQSTAPRGHEWITHRYLGRGSTVIHVGAHLGDEPLAFLQHYGSNVIVLELQQERIPNLRARLTGRYVERALVKPLDMHRLAEQLNFESQHRAVDLLTFDPRFVVDILSLIRDLVRHKKVLARIKHLQFMVHDITAEQHCTLRELLFQSHQPVTFHINKEVWRLRGVHDTGTMTAFSAPPESTVMSIHQMSHCDSYGT